MRIAMMGTGSFAVPTFQWLIESPHDVVTLVTRPSKPTGGRREFSTNPMMEASRAYRLPTLTPESINSTEAQTTLSRLELDLLVVCDYGQILSRRTLEISRLGGINLHGSLLPKYRGAAPVHWAIYNGEKETGVTVIHMTPHLDAGPCLSLRRVDIDPHETAHELEQRLAEMGVGPVREAIDSLERWNGKSEIGERQDPSKATKAPRLTKDDGEVDWTRTARQIYDQVRAMKPWPGTYTHWQRRSGEPMRIILDEATPCQSNNSQCKPGTVAVSEPGRLLVGTGNGLLRIDRLQPAGKRIMSFDEFQRGHRLGEGDKFVRKVTKA